MKRVCVVKLGHYEELPNIKRDAETLASQGYGVDVLCLHRKGKPAREITGGVNICRLPGEHRRQSAVRYLFEYTYFFIIASLVLSWRSLKKKYDAIEICSMPDFLVFTTIVPRLFGTKIVLYLCENMAELFTLNFNAPPNHPVTKVLRVIEKASASYAHHVIVADGIPYRKVLESHGVPSHKITVVLNVPDDVAFALGALSPHRENGHQFRVVVATTHAKRYGVQTLIKAVPMLVRDIPGLKVHVTGDGEYRSELEKLCRELGVQGHVNFTGRVSYADVLSYVAQAHVAVAPMLYDVGVSIKLFEYFAAGTPTVASYLPSLTATFSNDCILYFPPGDERALADRILELYHDPQKRASLARSAQEFYLKCQWQVMKNEYLRVYDECLK